MTDYTNFLPDDCLALIFNFLKNTNDRNNSSLVSHRWLRIDAQTRTHLTLNVHSNLLSFIIPPILTRFNSLTRLVLRNNPKGLNNLHVDQWNKMREIGYGGFIPVWKHCVNLRELVFIEVNARFTVLGVIGANCQNLVRLELCRCETITDGEISFIANKCVALKFLRIEECGVSNNGIEALGLGCPNLVCLTVTNCRRVTDEVKNFLRACRGWVSLAASTGIFGSISSEYVFVPQLQIPI